MFKVAAIDSYSAYICEDTEVPVSRMCVSEVRCDCLRQRSYILIYLPYELCIVVPP